MSLPVYHRSAGRFLRMPHRFNTFGTLRLMRVVGVVLLPRLSSAQWTATIGAQSHDLARQSLAFLPNELWIHAGDSITWTLATDERHTVTFLPANQAVPDVSTGCPGFANGAATFDGNTCATSPRLGKGQTFAVTFPVAGNFKLTCLLHPNMTGTIHVLDASESLPHDQAFYDREAEREASALLDDDDGGHAGPEHHHAHDGVGVGAGQINATGGGTSTLSVMRFQASVITAHAGDTVEWINDDPLTPHTVTFGTEPLDPAALQRSASILTARVMQCSRLLLTMRAPASSRLRPRTAWDCCRHLREPLASVSRSARPASIRTSVPCTIAWA